MKKRRTFDDQGNPVVEHKNSDGLFERDVDKSAIRKLSADALELSEPASTGPVPKGQTPYGNAATVDAKKLKSRSSLDYLRELSAEIKRKREREGKK